MSELKEQEALVLRYLRLEYDRLGLAPIFTGIVTCKNFAKRRVDLKMTIPRMFEKYYAYYTGDTSKGRACIFNGKYYEPVSRAAISNALLTFLREPDSMNRFGKTQDYDLLNVDRDYMKEVYHRGIMNNPMDKKWSVFAFENCVVDFETMKRVDFRQDEKGNYVGDDTISPDLMTMTYMPFVFERKDILKCTLWRSFLRMTFSDVDEAGKIDLLQMFLGSALMDRKLHKFEYFLVMQGDGRNGKSLIRDVMQDIFGSEDIVDFSIPQIEGATPDKANNRWRMSKARFLWLSESNSGEFKRSEILKRIVSYEKYSVYQKFHDADVATHAPLVMCNSNFKFTKEDFANPKNPGDISLYRRVNILNFRHVVPEDKVDPNLREKLSHEKAAIFAWVVKGLMMLRKNNYRLPEVKDGIIEKCRMQAGNMVKLDNGMTMRGSIYYYIVDKKFEPFSRGRGGIKRYVCHSSDLYDNYKDYCEKNNLECFSMHVFGRDMRYYGFNRVQDRDNGGKIAYEVFAWYKNMDELIHTVPSRESDALLAISSYDKVADDEFIESDKEERA